MSEILNFQFFCPDGREDVAAALLQSLECVVPNSVAFNASRIEKVTIKATGEILTETGFGIVGQALPECRKRIVKLLADQGIAGYSKETRIIFYNPASLLDENTLIE